MKTALPTHQEYYRLTRARELRRKAARLEWCMAHRRLVGCAAPLLLGLVVAAWTRMPEFFVLAFCCLFLGPWLEAGWRDRSRELLAAADALEAEHQSRYGGLAAGEET